MSAGASPVLRARKLKLSSEKLWPEAAVMVKYTASCAAEWFVGDEKNPAAPLTCAALLQPELEVSDRKLDSLPSDETVMLATGVAAFDMNPSVKLKFARVAACADE